MSGMVEWGGGGHKEKEGGHREGGMGSSLGGGWEAGTQGRSNPSAPQETLGCLLVHLPWRYPLPERSFPF